jgi:RimJ/RimL family protein N-acetyltransferase
MTNFPDFLGAVIRSPRLEMTPIALGDHAFIEVLTNTPEWIRFIGDRNIRNSDDARAYIQKIQDSPNLHFWVVRPLGEDLSMGVVSFIKRDYLEHHDIGFAFLMDYTKKGYAQEAARAVLQELVKNGDHEQILATTIPDNVASIQLLEKLGLTLERELEVEDLKLLLYATPAATFLAD